MDGSIPSASLRADSPSLPAKQHDPLAPTGPAVSDTIETIQLSELVAMMAAGFGHYWSVNEFVSRYPTSPATRIIPTLPDEPAAREKSPASPLAVISEPSSEVLKTGI